MSSNTDVKGFHWSHHYDRDKDTAGSNIQMDIIFSWSKNNTPKSPAKQRLKFKGKWETLSGTDRKASEMRSRVNILGTCMGNRLVPKQRFFLYIYYH